MVNQKFIVDCLDCEMNYREYLDYSFYASDSRKREMEDFYKAMSFLNGTPLPDEYGRNVAAH